MLSNHLKNEEVKKIITAGAVLVVLYWALNNFSVIFSVFSKVLSLIMPFLVGGVIAFIMNVPMKIIERHILKSEKYQTEKYASVRRAIAYVLTIVFLIAVIATALFVVIPQLVYTITDIVKLIPGQVQNIQSWLIQQFEEYPQLEEQLASIQIDWDSILTSLINFISTGTKGLITGGIDVVSSVVSGVATFFVGFTFSIYILFQKEKLSRQTKKILYAFCSKKNADNLLQVARLANSTFSNFITGQCLEAVILGSMFCITMLIIRLPYAVLIGIVIAITALIPIVGAFIGCAIGVILIALVSPIKALVFLIMFFVLQQLEGNLIYPHVVGNSVGLPGMWVFVAVTLGGKLFGIAGMLAFIPICSVCYALFKVYVNNRLRDKKMEDIV